MELLCDPVVRNAAGVNPANQFVFASTRHSLDHQSGWHALFSIADSLNLKEPDKIKATTNRHRISTFVAALDMPDQDRQLFYKHFGHSSEINENVYQNPVGIREVTQVGKRLLKIDEGI